MPAHTAAFDHLFLEPADFEASLAFYRNQLGWKVLTEWGDRQTGRGAVLASSAGMKLVLAEPHTTEDRSWTGGVAAGRPTVHLRVDDVDALHRQLTPGTKVVIAPEDTHWGVRWLVLEDPDGNRFAFFREIQT